MFQLFFTDRPVTDYHSAKSAEYAEVREILPLATRLPVFVPPSQFETCFLSAAHTEDELDATLDAIGTAVKTLPR